MRVHRGIYIEVVLPTSPRTPTSAATKIRGTGGATIAEQSPTFLRRLQSLVICSSCQYSLAPTARDYAVTCRAKMEIAVVFAWMTVEESLTYWLIESEISSSPVSPTRADFFGYFWGLIGTKQRTVICIKPVKPRKEP